MSSSTSFASEDAAPISINCDLAPRACLSVVMSSVTRYFSLSSGKVSARLHQALRKRYGYQNLDSIPDDALSEALMDLRALEKQAWMAWRAKQKAETEFLACLEELLEK